MYATVLAGCLETKTTARTKELAALLHCKEGDPRKVMLTLTYAPKF
jgi:hypothetical protein